MKTIGNIKVLEFTDYAKNTKKYSNWRNSTNRFNNIKSSYYDTCIEKIKYE